MSSNPIPADAVVPTPERWASISRHVLNSYAEANSAVLAAMGLRSPGESTATEPAVPEVSYGHADWTTERSSDSLAELSVGDSVRFTKSVDEADVAAFAQVSGDTNRLHLESAFAEDTRFGGPIAHGTLVSGAISAALARFPGLTVYLSQDLEFQGPVEIGSTITADCEIVEELGGGRYRLRTTVDSEGERVVDGEAVVLIEDEPE
ncbi:MaoC family dehydratase [Natronococcus sp. JC468]|uniref:MaoC family dehydratase n=1 Tax=Natronococcus sp. JC468 TaxID=1961921 RepID=UPI00143931B1|nr:MaoC family dehydratase [Natronococcus sp. JC468]NKE35931.1 MaoC family dehydratase [Natronococcus sp. JC468]